MKNLFHGGIDTDFINWGTDVAGTATTETPFEVYEMIKNGTFKQILDAFEVEDLKEFCWSQDQIVEFVEDHPDRLHPQGWATFFLFKVKFDDGTDNGREDFFVAGVYRNGVDQIEVRAHRLSSDYVWCAERRPRFVFPQRSL